MKSSRLLFAVMTLASLFTWTVATATAGSMGNGAAQRMKLVIESIDGASGAVRFKSQVDNSEHTYKIVAATKIKVGNLSGTIDQIQPGMKVDAYAVKHGQAPGDGQTLTFIFVTPAAPAT